MFRRFSAAAVPAFASLALLTGCANPADNKPAAEVTEAQEVAAPSAEAVAYTITPESTLTFVGSKVTGSHDGGFKTFTGTISVPGEDLTQAQVAIEIDMNSTWSDNDGLTEHLKNADFFDVPTYPTAKFTTTAIAKTEAGYEVTGNLELHGQTKSITFPAQITMADGKVTAQAEFSINRSDWGIVYPGKTDDLIREEVVITFDLTAAA